MRLVEGGASSEKDNPPLADILSEAQLNGIPINTVVGGALKSGIT